MKCTTLIAATAALTAVVPYASADSPDAASGVFWNQEGRASYPGATPPATATAIVATVPQVAGEPAFDSGTGDMSGIVLLTEFSSHKPATIILFK